MLDSETLDPRPDYWAALLWKRLMGDRVLNPGVPPTDETHAYAMCESEAKGAVALVVLNLDQRASHSVRLPVAGYRYTLSAPQLLMSAALRTVGPSHHSQE